MLLPQVVIQYRSAGRLLQGAERVWAHAGHSGWQHTLDVELFRTQLDDGLWTGTYKIPASQLAAPSHVEVQIVFKGQMAKGHIVWDNNEGNNWQVGLWLRMCAAGSCRLVCVGLCSCFSACAWCADLQVIIQAAVCVQYRMPLPGATPSHRSTLT
jgi:hypothetical protein